YQGALQLQLQHTDVKKVSAEVLKAFFCLETGTSNRRIRQLASSFRNIQYGEVRARNMPDELKKALADHGRATDSLWVPLIQPGSRDKLDDILVEIKRNPEGEEAWSLSGR